jgi:hypothetical protein
VKHASIVAAAAALLCFWSADVRADGGPKGIELGLRSGYAIGLGNVAQNSSMSDFMSGAVPIWVDAGYRFSPDFFLGGYFQYAFAFLGNKESSACNQGGETCSSPYVMLYGVQAHYHISPDSIFDPWVGYGFGWEQATIGVTQGGQSGSLSATSWSYAILQIGGDYRVNDLFAIGPVVMFDLGEYQNVSVSANGRSISQSVPQQDFHEWLTFALRGVFDIAVGR